MTDAQIDELVADLVGELDYDIYKDIYEHPEDRVEADATKARLREIVRYHLDPLGATDKREAGNR